MKIAKKAKNIKNIKQYNIALVGHMGSGKSILGKLIAKNLKLEHIDSDKLIVSITSDIHVTKAELRPYVPERLRAENLAALEFVDYVIIDENETPTINLKKIQPDYFVKGYEYSKINKNSKTKEEMKILQSYGGKFLFTPGD